VSAKFHLWMMVVWAVLLIPTLLWWRESVLWVAVMSWYANLVGHWGSYQAARAEQKIEEQVEATKEACADKERPCDR